MSTTATSVRLDTKFVAETKVYAEVAKRTVPKQIEHWATIGKILEDNPDLTYQFVHDALLAKAESEQNLVNKYERRKKR